MLPTIYKEYSGKMSGHNGMFANTLTNAETLINAETVISMGEGRSAACYVELGQ